MEEFKEAYKHLCKKYHIAQQDIILQYLKGLNDGRVCLDLSACNIPCSICLVLGKALASDCTITDLCFCNCMLPYDSMKAILEGLCKNSSVKNLHLKGNGLCGTQAEDIGKLLSLNHNLYQLSLEWNCLGKFCDQFKAFCAGLTVNNSLKVLDLRSNQINNQCAVALASALTKNCSLQCLDLRWNLVGHLGASALLNVLQQNNKSLTKLDLEGNSGISEEMMKAIDKILADNSSLQLQQEQHDLRTKQLMNEIEKSSQSVKPQIQINEFKSLSLSPSSITPDAVTSDAVKLNEDTKKIKTLENELHERKLAYNKLIERVNNLETVVNKTEEQNKKMNQLINELQLENSKLKELQQHALLKENIERFDAETKLISEMDDVKEDRRRLVIELECAMRTHELQNGKIQKLQENNEMLETKLKMTEIAHIEQLESLKQQNKEAIKVMDEARQKDLEKMKGEVEEIEKSFNESLQRLENQRSQFEKEIFQLNGKLIEEKTKTEELLQNQRLKFQEELENQCSELSEKLRTLQKEKDEQTNLLKEKCYKLEELESMKEIFQTEKENLFKNMQQLKQQLSIKNEDLQMAISDRELELRRIQDELIKEKQNHGFLQSQINQMQASLKETEKQYLESLDLKDREISSLKETIKRKEKEYRDKQKLEIERVNILTSAIQNYVGNSSQIFNYPHHRDFTENVSNCTATEFQNFNLTTFTAPSDNTLPPP